MVNASGFLIDSMEARPPLRGPRKLNTFTPGQAQQPGQKNPLREGSGSDRKVAIQSGGGIPRGKRQKRPSAWPSGSGVAADGSRDIGADQAAMRCRIPDHESFEPQIRVLDLRIGQERRSLVRQDDAASLDHVTSIGDLQDCGRILFDQQHRDAGSAQRHDR